jgi:type III pantothenate kinase
MKLVIDLGNSRLKWALCGPTGWQPGEPCASGEIPAAWATLGRPDGAWLASVARADVSEALCVWVQRTWNLNVEHVTARREAFGVRVLYESPETLGADRFAALVGARDRAQGACVMVDCGTAVTVDALAENGQYLGGVILPGLAMMRAALTERTGLIRASGGRADEVCARTTQDGVAAGTLIGLAGAIDALVARQKDRLGPADVILTGGDAAMLRPLLRMDTMEIPDLVLRGLAVVAGCKAAGP